MMQLIENYLNKIQEDDASKAAKAGLSKWKAQLQKSVDACKSKCNADKKCLNLCEIGKQKHLKHTLVKILSYCKDDKCKNSVQRQIKAVDKKIAKLS